jgi:hypothetical protein
VQTDGVQPISWIETDGGDIRESSARDTALGYIKSPDCSLGLRAGSKTIRELMQEQE